MSKRKFLFSITFLKHLLLAIFLILLLIVIALQILKIYTHHGNTYAVPNFVGAKGNAITEIAKKNYMRYEIIDSVHVDFAQQGAVVEQVPEASSNVKKGRKILLTINSVSPETVIIPKLTDISFRQAQGLIENSGLKIGNISFQESEYNELVLNISANGKNLKEGSHVNKNTKIDITVGRHGNITTRLPKLYKNTLYEAEKNIATAMLNLGQVIFDNSVSSNQDKAKAKVWKQQPDNNSISIVNAGTKVSIWLTLDKEKIVNAAKTEPKDDINE